MQKLKAQDVYFFEDTQKMNWNGKSIFIEACTSTSNKALLFLLSLTFLLVASKQTMWLNEIMFVHSAISLFFTLKRWSIILILNCVIFNSTISYLIAKLLTETWGCIKIVSNHQANLTSAPNPLSPSQAPPNQLHITFLALTYKNGYVHPHVHFGEELLLPHFFENSQKMTTTVRSLAFRIRFKIKSAFTRCCRIFK